MFMILPVATIDATVLERTVNDWREESGYTRLVHDKSLCMPAAKRTIEIQHNWSHDGFKRITKTVKHKQMGENLAKDFYSEWAILNAWLNSPLHRANLERPYTHTCIVCSNNHCTQLLRR